MAMCAKCGTDNDNTRLTCFRCGMGLPKLSTEDLSGKSEVNLVIDENSEAKDIVKASDCIFLTSLKNIKTYIDEGAWTPEELQVKIDAVKQESNYILDLINSFSDEEKSWMKSGLDKIDQSYDMFHESFAKLEQFMAENNPSLVDEAMKTATEASHMLLEGINEAQDELGVEEDKLTDEMQGEEFEDEDFNFDEELPELSEDEEDEEFEDDETAEETEETEETEEEQQGYR